MPSSLFEEKKEKSSRVIHFFFFFFGRFVRILDMRPPKCELCPHSHDEFLGKQRGDVMLGSCS
eukprot:m.932007 g.932007  ORF g.932007 m.932007 type:complete len:63 (+) comp187921_c0_seq1:50-238(+)